MRQPAYEVKVPASWGRSVVNRRALELRSLRTVPQPEKSLNTEQEGSRNHYRLCREAIAPNKVRKQSVKHDHSESGNDEEGQGIVTLLEGNNKAQGEDRKSEKRASP